MPGVMQTIDGARVLGLTLWRPWPWAFTHADKDVENRPWPMPRRIDNGWIALHSGKRFDAEAALAMASGEFTAAAVSCPQRDDEHPSSVITCIVRARGYFLKQSPSRKAGQEWHFGPYCWRTPRDELVVLPRPVACRGAQGLWELPRDVFLEVAAQVQEVRTGRTS